MILVTVIVGTFAVEEGRTVAEGMLLDTVVPFEEEVSDGEVSLPGGVIVISLGSLLDGKHEVKNIMTKTIETTFLKIIKPLRVWKDLENIIIPPVF